MSSDITISVFCTCQFRCEELASQGVPARFSNELALREDFERLDIDKVKYLRLGFQPYMYANNILFIAMNSDESKILGGLVLEETKSTDPKDHRDGCRYNILSVATHQDFEHQGIARSLAETLFSFCRENGLSGVGQSSYTKPGARMIPMFERLSEQYPDVNFFDRKEVRFF